MNGSLLPRLALLTLLPVAALLFCLGIDVQETYQGTFFYAFQARDLDRARLLLAGQPIFFGPEMTGGGNLPGPLYYAILALAMAVHPGWLGTWAGMLLLAGAGGLVGWYWFRTRISAAAGWLWLALYSTSYFTQVLLELYLNISYVLFFAVAAFFSLCESCIADSEPRRNRFFALFCLLVSLSLQLHFSLIFLFIAGLTLRPVRGRALVMGLLFFALPWLPYLGWLLGAVSGQSSGMVGRSREALPTIVSYASNIARLPAAATVAHLWRLLEVLPVPLLLAFVSLWGRGVSSQPKEKRLARVFLVCGLWGLLPFSYFFVAPIGRRYVVPLGLALLALAVLAFERCRRSPAAARTLLVSAACLAVPALLFLVFTRATSALVEDYPLKIVACSGAFFLACLFSCGLRWRAALPMAATVMLSAWLCLAQRAFIKLGFTNTSHVNGMRYIPSMGEWAAVWKIVRGKTCWSYEEARRRIYYVNHHLEQEPSFSWEASEPGEGCEEGMPRPGAPDGYFVSILKRDAEPVLPWLLGANLHADVKRALREGAVTVEEPSLSRGFLVVPYRVHDKNRFPSSFHDLGAGYLRPGRSGFEEPARAAAEARVLGDGRLLFRWNECAGLRPFCDTGAYVALGRGNGRFVDVHVRVVGPAISQTSPWISPNWTESWRRPYVEVSCAGKPERRELADSIGYERVYGHRPDFPFDYNNSLVAPFERSYRVACRGFPRAVSVGREATAVETLKEMKLLPPRKLTLELSRPGERPPR